MPTLARIDVHPVKALDPHAVERVEVADSGALAPDRRYAVVDADGEYVNGKREAAIHRLGATYDLDAGTVAVGERGGATETFHLDDDRTALSAWLSDYFRYEVRVVRDDVGMPDRRGAGGPTVVATGTLDRVGDWFDLDRGDVRRRFRANLIVDAPAFWEDRLYAGRGEVRRFTVGDVAFEGLQPCGRCVVPTRDPDTGEETPADFRERFVERRRETLPDWADERRFDHYFRLCPVTRLASEGIDGEGGEPVAPVAVGDAVRVDERRPR